jgi:hypothetical protein
MEIERGGPGRPGDNITTYRFSLQAPSTKGAATSPDWVDIAILSSILVVKVVTTSLIEFIVGRQKSSGFRVLTRGVC